MNLRENLTNKVDFFLVSQSIWIKLLACFGGAPEIPLFAYTESQERYGIDGELIEP